MLDSTKLHCTLHVLRIFLSSCISTEKSIKQTQHHADVEEEQTADRNREDDSEDKVQVFEFLLIFKVGIKLKQPGLMSTCICTFYDVHCSSEILQCKLQ